MSLFVSWLTAMASASCPAHHDGSLEVSSDGVPPCLETVDGDLVVRGEGGPLVFSSLTDVTGNLDVAFDGTVHMPVLERVHGKLDVRVRGTSRVSLPRLQFVRGPLGLDLSREGPGVAIPRLRRLTKGLWLFAAGSLARVLPSLEAVGGTVYIQPVGPIADGLSHLERIGGHLVLNNGAGFEFSGLDGLARVGGDAYLFGGQELALPGLRRVGGALAIRGSHARHLANVGRNGTSVGALLLRDNPQLEVWPSHLHVPKGKARAEGNPALSVPSAP